MTTRNEATTVARPLDRRVGHRERRHARVEEMRPLNTAVFLMPFEEKLSLVKEHGWGNKGDWNNWFEPTSGWNYDLHDAVVRILSLNPQLFPDARDCMSVINKLFRDMVINPAAATSAEIGVDSVRVTFDRGALERSAKVLAEEGKRAELCVAACEGIPDYQLVGENGEPNRLGDMIDALRDSQPPAAAHPLQTIFDQCVEQAVSGKGEERHGHGADFFDQPWKQIADRQGLGFLMGQAEKKIGEATAMLQQNPGPDGVEFWQKEIRGAMNYLAMAMLFVEEEVAELEGCGECDGCECGEEAAPAGGSGAPLRFNPSTGHGLSLGVRATDVSFWRPAGDVRVGFPVWNFNPWTGEPRDQRDVLADPFGHQITPF